MKEKEEQSLLKAVLAKKVDAWTVKNTIEMQHFMLLFINKYGKLSYVVN